MKTSELLLKALDVIDTKERWTKNHSARDARGQGASVLDPTACSFCITGAISKVVGRTAGQLRNANLARDAIGDVIRRDLELTNTSITGFNDLSGTRHKKVVKVMMTAAFNLLAQEQPAYPGATK